MSSDKKEEVVCVACGHQIAKLSCPHCFEPVDDVTGHLLSEHKIMQITHSEVITKAKEEVLIAKLQHYPFEHPLSWKISTKCETKIVQPRRWHLLVSREEFDINILFQMIHHDNIYQFSVILLDHFDFMITCSVKISTKHKMYFFTSMISKLSDQLKKSMIVKESDVDDMNVLEITILMKRI